MSKKKTFFDLRNFDNYINYEKRKKELFKGYQPGYIAQIEDSLNATDAQYNYTKITGKPETIEEYYANNIYLGNKANVIKDIKNNLQDKDRILRREENQPKSGTGKMYETSEEKLQAFPHGIQKRFFDWTTTEANRIYKELISNNYLSDWEIAVKEGDKIARETEERARQREEEEEYELPSHNSNGNTIHYNSNGNPVASWEEEMAHWNSVMAEQERNKMQEENWDSQYMEEEKRRKEEEEKAEQEAMKNPVIKNRRDVGRRRLIERVQRKRRAQEEAANAASMEKSGSSVAAPPPQSFAAPSSSVADTQELTNEWVEKISKSKGTTYYFNTRTGKTSWVKPPTIPPPTIPQELYHIGWRTRYDTDKNKYVFDFKPEEVWNTTKMPENMVRNVEELPVEKELSPELIDKGWSSGLSSTRGYYYYKNNKTGKSTYHAQEVVGGKKTRKVKGKGKTMKKNIKVKKSIKKKQRKTKRKGKN
jgi:hypothetical protein